MFLSKKNRPPGVTPSGPKPAPSDVSRRSKPNQRACVASRDLRHNPTIDRDTNVGRDARHASDRRANGRRANDRRGTCGRRRPLAVNLRGPSPQPPLKPQQRIMCATWIFLRFRLLRSQAASGTAGFASQFRSQHRATQRQGRPASRGVPEGHVRESPLP